MSYEQEAQEKLNKLRDREDYLILAFESSCDETAVAVIRGREILANEIDSQIEIHKRFGGVVPEIASRNHILAIDSLVEIALEKAGCTLDDIDVIAVTYGAGLLGALLVGVSYAKSLAYALNKPLVAIDHIKGHVCANFLAHPDLKFPFMCLLASGGHTEILDVRSYSDMRILGQTADDAAGEAFDKVARVIGLPYPGGPQIERAAKEGKDCIPLPRPFKGEKTYNFSYSGIKTAVINYAHTCAQKGIEINKADVAASFQARAVGMLIENAVKAAQEHGEGTIVIAGGVAANTALREGMEKAAKKHGITVLLPPKYLCTDNAAMIGEAAFCAIKEGIPAAGMDLDADPNL
ncbi:MAG: tRNA (adenosine(37)-N6)-threonylcarbamoyltransferase complex transferase subunit TsaD [Clostridia bacterium]|nr:tRNA (adenosine(37)-N6)-threonylcarbamoyltransferase complex transferase subunit TsaD [Clostridia bacterium]